MAEAPRVAMLGDVFVDMQADGVSGLPEWGMDRTAAAVHLLPGGSCANTARNLAGLARGALSVSLFSALGDDELGRYFLRRVKEEGLLHSPESTLRLLPRVSQSCCIILSGMKHVKPLGGLVRLDADRAMVSCYSSTSQLSVSECAPELGDSEWALLHLGGYFNCPKLHTEDLLGLCRSVRSSGGIVSFDPQFDASEKWQGEGQHLHRLLSIVDVMLPSEIEAMGIAGTQESPNAAMEELSRRYPSALVVVKLGAKGAIAARGAERWKQPVFPTQVVDATGAGDAFDAGFLLQFLLDNTNVEAALRAGAAAGAATVARSGACVNPLEGADIQFFLETSAGS
eukprot:scaffold114180_cov29-Tisochrysis_lutea.AAC.2